MDAASALNYGFRVMSNNLTRATSDSRTMLVAQRRPIVDSDPDDAEVKADVERPPAKTHAIYFGKS